MRRAGEVVIDYELSITSPLPKRDAILKSKNNKQRLANVLCTFNVGENVTMETQQDGVFGHGEADVTMVSYVLEAANSGKDVICVLSDDTDVFILLVYWVHRAGLQCKVEMERWDGTLLDIKATCADLGPKCLQLLGMHALSGCDTTSYPFGKGKISALNTLLAGDFLGLADVLGEVGSTHTALMEAAKPFFVSLYHQLPGTSMETARFTLFTKKKRPKIMALPSTSTTYSSMCCGLICRSCYGKQQTTKPHLMNQLISPSLGGISRTASPFLQLLRVPQLHQNWLMLFSASAKHKARSAALRLAVATKNTLHAHLIVTAMEKMTAAIRIQGDKVHRLEMRRMLRKRMLKRPLRWWISILKKPRWTMKKKILWRRF